MSFSSLANHALSNLREAYYAEGALQKITQPPLPLKTTKQTNKHAYFLPSYKEPKINPHL
jgi:hypothetical protein